MKLVMRVAVEVEVGGPDEAAAHQRAFEEALAPMRARYPAANLRVGPRRGATPGGRIRRVSGAIGGYQD
jgi:hypothetical protein